MNCAHPLVYSEFRIGELFNKDFEVDHQGRKPTPHDRASDHPLFTDPPIKKNLRRFTLFPQLVPELQEMIWEHAVADVEPRIVEFFLKDYEVEQQRELKVRHQIPALLHVSQEARAVALKAYQKFLDKEGCYLNPRKDVVFMQDSDVPKIYDIWLQHREQHGGTYETDVEKEVRNLVIGGEHRYPSVDDLKKCGFCQLQKIILQKAGDDLTSRQEAHLDHTDWKHLGGCHFKNHGRHNGLELSFLPKEKMNKKVCNSSDPSKTDTEFDTSKTILSTLGVETRTASAQPNPRFQQRSGHASLRRGESGDIPVT